MENNKLRVVMLCGNGQSSRIMYHGLASHVNIECIILENKPSSKTIIERRIKKLGLLSTTGQLMFMALNKLLSKASKARVKQLLLDYQLSDESLPTDLVKKVETVNSDETISLLTSIKPDAVVVNGTRIISKDILSSVHSTFINTHMGITPKYRGVHGGYWALATGDQENCGVTVHLVDQGIDTGGVLYQDIISVEDADNFNTYPIQQIAKAIPLMKAALDDVNAKRITVKQNTLPSYLWYHPTLFQYVKNWLLKGVK